MKLLCSVVLAVVTATSLAEVNQVVDYTGHKVVSLVPKTKTQLDLLRSLREKYADLDFWTEPNAVGVAVHVRLSPAMQEELAPFFEITGFSSSSSSSAFTVLVENLQSVIDEEKADNEKTGYSAESPVGRYARLGDIHAWLDELAIKYPDLAKTFIVGKTYEGRSIKGIKIGDNDNSKPVIWIQAGIHAREWIAPASCVYIINYLLSNYATDASVKSMVDGVAWYLVPSANPDGYEYSHRYDRLWRKTRTPNSGYSCKGTDPNRNWDDHFGLTGTSNYPCSEIYRGPYAFSEPNTKALSTFIYNMKDRIKVFFSFHCYSQMWLTPWGWTDSARDNPSDHDELQRVAKGGTAALNTRHRMRYSYGPSGQILYPAAGAEDDWAKGVAGIKYAYTLELRPGPYANNGFVLPTKQIIPTGEEVYSGVSWVVKDVFNL